MAGNWNSIGQLGRSSRRQLLRRAAVGGAGLAGAGLLACGGRGGNPGTAPGSTPPEAGGQPQRGGTYNFHLAANPSLDPMQHGDLSTHRLAGAVLSRLFRYKSGVDPNVINNHDLENDLALSAESPDALTWTFKLRPGARFHDIPPASAHTVEAEDIKGTF